MSKVYDISLTLPDDRKVTLQVDENTFILDAAAKAGLDLPHTCLQGWCLTCAGQVIDRPATCIDNSAALRYYPEDQEGGFVLLCTAKPRQNCHLVTHQAWAMKIYRRKRGRPTPGGKPMFDGLP